MFSEPEALVLIFRFMWSDVQHTLLHYGIQSMPHISQKETQKFPFD